MFGEFGFLFIIFGVFWIYLVLGLVFCRFNYFGWIICDWLVFVLNYRNWKNFWRGLMVSMNLLICIVWWCLLEIFWRYMIFLSLFCCLFLVLLWFVIYKFYEVVFYLFFKECIWYFMFFCFLLFLFVGWWSVERFMVWICIEENEGIWVLVLVFYCCEMFMVGGYWFGLWNFYW